jgi:hypothetical protein
LIFHFPDETLTHARLGLSEFFLHELKLQNGEQEQNDPSGRENINECGFFWREKQRPEIYIHSRKRENGLPIYIYNRLVHSTLGLKAEVLIFDCLSICDS